MISKVVCQFFPDEPLVREDVADYLGECMAVDRAEVIIEEIEKRGELDNTFIVVSAIMVYLVSHEPNVIFMTSEVSLMMRLLGLFRGVIDDMTNIMDVAPLAEERNRP